jgi:hypothetical protein
MCVINSWNVHLFIFYPKTHSKTGCVSNLRASYVRSDTVYNVYMRVDFTETHLFYIIFCHIYEPG